MRVFGSAPQRLFAKPDDEGAEPHDPTMKKGPGSLKGENMPPSGGESMAPADSGRKPPPPRGSEDEPKTP